MSGEPTGVFVRLPLSNEQLGKLLAPIGTLNERMISIGTPVTGGKEICSGSVKWHENDREPTLETYVPNAFGRGTSVKIVTLSDHQAQIAVLEAEVGRLENMLSQALTTATLRASKQTCEYLVREAFSLSKTAGMSSDDVVRLTVGEMFQEMGA